MPLTLHPIDRSGNKRQQLAVMYRQCLNGITGHRSQRSDGDDSSSTSPPNS